MSRSKLEFLFQDAVALDVKVSIEKACLYVRKVKVNPNVLKAHEDGLEKSSNAIYPIQQSDMMSYTIPNGSSYHMQDNLFRGQTLKLIVVGLVENAVFNGDGKTDPLLFQHFDISHIALQRDGECVPYCQPIQMNYKDKVVGQAYMAMIQSLEMYNSNLSNGITLEKFMKGQTLFVFNLTPDLSASGSWGQPYQTGNVRLEVKFSKALHEGINVIIMAIRDGRLEITKQRQVLKS